MSSTRSVDSLLTIEIRLSVEIPPSDDFEAMKKEWEEISAFDGGDRGYPHVLSGRKVQNLMRSGKDNNALTC
ncbi:hypothetical protein E3N88_04009 [Mikania micrantha]|uniref:Uncharacterized protein n=1 Tax=Mikania micrantha TaxID=192012 RepID=A0A5N6PVD3_9ASTR|nr:hypothetical protein E3N88_04009 [Mikania micrantha]